jgi:predicted nuclease of predicted toxin-antitoxin system
VAAFYLEDGLPLQLATQLFRLGHVATTSRAQGRQGARDEEHLWLAAQQGWVLVTQNGTDFRMLHRAWLLWGVPQPHAGSLVFLTQVAAALAP